MTVEQFPNPRKTVQVFDDRIELQGLVIFDAVLVDVLCKAPDPERLLLDLIELGVRARNLADNRVDEDSVKHKVQLLEERFNTKVESAVSALDERATNLFGEGDSGINRAFTDFRNGLHEDLHRNFSPDIADSWMNKFDLLMKKSIEQEVLRLRNEFDSTRDDSSLGVMKRSLKSVIDAAQQDLVEQFDALKSQLIESKTKKDALSKQSRKGGQMEEAIHEVLAPMCAAKRDTLDLTGNSTGVMGTKKGDLVVRLNSLATGNRILNIAIESKAAGRTTKAIDEEIHLGMANRAAKVGLAVFDRPNTPTGISDDFTEFSDWAIVVIDREAPDENVLRYAYLWARWTLLRDVMSANAGVDLQAVESAVTRIQEQLKTVSTVKRDHGAVANALRLADMHLTQLEMGISAELKVLEQTLANEVSAATSAVQSLALGAAGASLQELLNSVEQYEVQTGDDRRALPLDKRDRQLAGGTRFADQFPAIATSNDTGWLSELPAAQQRALRAHFGKEAPTLGELGSRSFNEIQSIQGLGEAAMNNLFNLLAEIE